MGNKQGHSRRQARLTAFNVLYGLNFSPVQEPGDLVGAFMNRPDPDAPDPGPVISVEGTEPQGFAWELVFGVWSRLNELDEVVKRFSQHWRLGRIAKIELTILRLALFEMLHRPDIPVKVAINEAVELAKMYGDDNSRGFVNGILDAAAKAIENGEIGIH